jgi:PELOTA RNA binding domain
LIPSPALGTRPLEAAGRALELARLHGALDANRIKASLGESWRALLRRRTRALLLGPDHPEQWAVRIYARVKGVPVIRFTQPLPYHCLALLEEHQ